MDESKVTVPGLGEFRVSLDAESYFYIERSFDSDYVGRYLADQLAGKINTIRTCSKINFVAIEPTMINRVPYRLEASVTLAWEEGRQVWWGGRRTGANEHLTDKARQKLHENAEATGGLLSYAKTNLEALRDQAVARLRADVQQRLDRIEANVRTIRDGLFPAVTK